MLFIFRVVFLAGSRANDTRAFSARWSLEEGRCSCPCSYFLFLHCIHIWVLDGWRELYFFSFYFVYASYLWLLLHALCWSLLLGHGSLTVISMKTVK